MTAPNLPNPAIGAAKAVRTIARPPGAARRLARAVTAALVALVGAGALAVAASPPAGSAPAPGPRLDIVKVSGLIDPINADLIGRSLRAAANDHALALVLELNSTGGTISASARDALAARMVRSPVPIAVWVGGSASPRALGTAFTLLRSADFTGEAPGSKVGNGPAPPQTVPDGLEHRTMSGDDAVDAHLINAASPTLVSFFANLTGHTFKGVHIDLGQANHGFRKDLTFNFSGLSVLPKLLHGAATPDVAFVMLLIAMALALFEFFTVGVGIAAATGVLFLIPASYGLGVLPVHPWAIVLLGVAFLGFAIDLQAGAPRFWTVVGGISYVVGALSLYQGRRASLWVIVLMGLLVAFFVITGMPAMVRSRFSTPTIGRESLIGRMGVAESGVDPEGTVRVDGAPWRARTNRATPIPAGDPVRVVAIDGLLLEVEPETGGARESHH